MQIRIRRKDGKIIFTSTYEIRAHFRVLPPPNAEVKGKSFEATMEVVVPKRKERKKKKETKKAGFQALCSARRDGKAAVNFRTLNAFIPFNSRSDITREQVQYGVEYKPASMSAKEWSAVANLIFLRKTLSRENRRERERRLDIAERGCCDGLREASKRMGNQFL
ncbi:hypothetical protein HZH68_005173 [Vespula germanica]|uniref:Uncharacterized protein n=1 Tax=Vespula germanica TaxID=30212 RepID=A0A834KD56_VESGE|nr:hypothetical protein HZH68_005173 [Vespula germanica]